MLPKLHLWPLTIVSLFFFRVCFSPEVLWKFFHSQCGVGCQKHDEKNIGRRRDPLLPPPLGRCDVHRGDAGQKGNFSTRSMDVFVGFTSRYRYLAVGGGGKKLSSFPQLIFMFMFIMLLFFFFLLLLLLSLSLSLSLSLLLLLLLLLPAQPALLPPLGFATPVAWEKHWKWPTFVNSGVVHRFYFRHLLGPSHYSSSGVEVPPPGDIWSRTLPKEWQKKLAKHVELRLPFKWCWVEIEYDIWWARPRSTVSWTSNRRANSSLRPKELSSSLSGQGNDPLRHEQ